MHFWFIPLTLTGMKLLLEIRMVPATYLLLLWKILSGKNFNHNEPAERA